MDSIRWLTAARHQEANWLVIADRLAAVQESKNWEGHGSWTGWLEKVAEAVNYRPNGLRRLLTCREFVRGTPVLRDFLREEEVEVVGKPEKAETCTLPAFVVENLMRLYRRAPATVESLLAGVRDRGDRLTVTQLRSLQASLQQADPVPPPSSRGRGTGAMTASERVERARRVELAMQRLRSQSADLSPGAPQIRLVNNLVFGSVAPSAVAVGFESGVIRFLDAYQIVTIEPEADGSRQTMMMAALAARMFRRYWVALVGPDGESLRRAADRLGRAIGECRLDNVGVAIAAENNIESFLVPSGTPVPDLRQETIATALEQLLS